VISDGSPMDSATHLANDAHLPRRGTTCATWSLERQEQRGDIEIAGIGVGLDLSPVVLLQPQPRVLDLATLHRQHDLSRRL
jgi:cobaltochelatase CobT